MISPCRKRLQRKNTTERLPADAFGRPPGVTLAFLRGKCKELAVFLAHPDSARGLGQVAAFQVLASDAKAREAVFGFRLFDERAGFLDYNEARLVRKAAFVNLAILNRAAGFR
jgi:hypothetical protein